MKSLKHLFVFINFLLTLTNVLSIHGIPLTESNPSTVICSSKQIYVPRADDCLPVSNWNQPCKYDEQCTYKLGRNSSVCLNELCVCDEGYTVVSNPLYGKRCFKMDDLGEIFTQTSTEPTVIMSTVKSIIDRTTCQTTLECNTKNYIDNIICAKGACACSPNYHWDPLKENCKSYRCQSHNDCKEYDSFRLCQSGSCVCNPLYTESTQNKLCYSNILGDCNSNIDCQQRGEVNQICIAKKCQCKNNYRFNITSKICVEFNCKFSLDCKDIDRNRECVNGKCECRDNLEESEADMMCITDNKVINSKETTGEKFSWPKKYWWVIMIGTIFGLILIITIIVVARKIAC